MFTGIIRGIGRIENCRECGGDLRLEVGLLDDALGSLALGDSVAVNGVCLTLAALSKGGFAADVSGETLARTTLGSLRAGNEVNLEPALRAGEPLGGHLVSGHVDGVGELRTRWRDARSWRMRYSAPATLSPYLAVKGSVSVDGVSLTINAVDEGGFEVNLVPHTLERTTLGGHPVGTAVNLEADQVARYLGRLLENRD